MLNYKYNPQNATADELKATFTARDAILKHLLDEMKSHAKSKSNQHYLVIGPRGIGKTNFLRMISISIKGDPELSASFIPVQFAEEEYGIGTLADFFEKVIECVKEEEGTYVWNGISFEDDDDVIVEKAIELLKKLSKSLKKKFVLLVDNLDLILGQQIKDDIGIKKLRDVLMNQDLFLLIGAAPTYFEQVSAYDKPLYNMFKTINLDELTDDEIEELIRRRAEYDGNKRLLDHIAEARPKLRALRHLTGGNPRLVLMLYQLLSMSELKEVSDYLEHLLDDLTPYYRSKLDWLSVQQRKIIDGIAKLDKAASPTDIAKATKLHVNVVSTNLKRLMDWGYVKLAKQERRKVTYYTISERMFRIWHQMRYSRGMRKKIQFFVEFIAIWYSVDELKTESNKLLEAFDELLKSGEPEKAKRIVEQLDYIAAASAEHEFRQQLFDNAINMSFKIGDFSGVEKRAHDLLEQGVRDKNDNRLLIGRMYLAGVYLFREDYLKALDYVDLVLKSRRDLGPVWEWQGAMLARLKRYEEAVRSFDEAIKINSKSYQAWYEQGRALNNLQKHEEALKCFEEALCIKSDSHEALFNKGATLGFLFREDETVATFDESLKVAKFEEQKQRSLWGLMMSHLLVVVRRLNDNNKDSAIVSFKSALQLFDVIQGETTKQAHEALVSWFSDVVISEEQIAFTEQLLRIVRESGREDIQSLLEPFAITNQYWGSGKDSEVLDSLNPEMREAVEQIIKKAEEKGGEASASPPKEETEK